MLRQACPIPLTEIDYATVNDVKYVQYDGLHLLTTSSSICICLGYRIGWSYLTEIELNCSYPIKKKLKYDT